MRVTSKALLRRFWDRNSASRNALEAWHSNVTNARWTSFADLKQSYPAADIVKASSNRVVFDISGNKLRLIAVVDFVRHGVLIRWIGTHAEYDKVDARNI